MKFKFAGIFILFISVTQSYATSKSTSCEAEMSIAAKAIVGLMSVSLEEKEISPSELRDFIAREDWSKPLSGRSRSERNLALRHGLARAAGRLQPQERAVVRDSLNALLKKISGEQVQTEQAKRNTEQVIGPSIRMHADKSANIINVDDSAFGWHQGRPVYMAIYAGNGGGYRVYLFDPFHPEKSSRFKELTGADVNASFRASLGFLHLKGRTYAAVFGFSNYAYDIESGKELTLVELGFKDMMARSGEDDYLVSSLVQGGDSIVVAVSESGISRLALFAGSDPIYYERTRFASIFDVDGIRYLVSKNPNQTNQIAVKNLTTNSPPQYFRDPIGDARLFEMIKYGKETYLTFMGNLPGDGRHRLTRINIENGETKSTEDSVDFLTQPRSVISQGVPYTYTGTKNGLVLIDLRTMDFKIVEVDRGGQKQFRSFELAGRVYIYWGTRIMDLESHEIVNEQSLEQKLVGMNVFEYGGLHYAIVDGESHMPVLIQLSRKTPSHP